MANEEFGLALKQPVIVIVGPTASGKTDVAQLVAQHVGANVVSADSMQIYRGMDVGTGKILPEEQVVKHYGLDICDPGEAYSAALFQDYARDIFAVADAQGCRSVLAGGTGLYVRAAIDDYHFVSGEQVDNPVRDKYRAYLEEHGDQKLWELLLSKDEKSAQIIHPHNSRRVARALEMLELEGKSYADQHKGFETMKQFVPAVFFGLNVDPEVLNNRINARVDGMVERGLIAEVESLLERGFEQACTASGAIGYKEIVAALQGDCTMDEAIDQIKLASRRYAKRQRTWWRNDARVTWIDATDANVQRIAEQVISSI